jgi:lipopolysaccharide transport system ATP-binding protein
VLAVGDAQFQKRCLGKMQDVSQKDGRTVLFVSHNMQAVQSLCGRAVRLDGGRVIAVDSARAIVTAYLSELSSAEGEKVWSEDKAPGNELCKLLRVAVRHPDAKPSRMLSSQREVWIEFDFTAEKLDPGLCVGFDLTTSEGVVVFRTYQTDQTPEDTPPVQIGVNRWRCVLPPGLLNGGVYFISPRIGIHNVSWIVNLDGVAEMEVVLDHGVSPFWNSLSASTRPGLTAPILPWKPVLN